VFAVTITFLRVVRHVVSPVSTQLFKRQEGGREVEHSARTCTAQQTFVVAMFSSQRSTSACQFDAIKSNPKSQISSEALPLPHGD